jgi:low affinity Fe/Cu permease
MKAANIKSKPAHVKKSGHKKGKRLSDSPFEKFAARITKATGSTSAFIVALGVVLLWAFTGPVFGFSETWQLVINTGTTIVTFLMVFLIQKTQNKDSLALQLKLNELVASHQFASNRLVDVENLTEEELITIQQYYKKLRDLTKNDQSLQCTHSIDEAHKMHDIKMKVNKTTSPVPSKKSDKGASV